MLDFIMLVNRQGKLRMVRWYHPDLTLPIRTRITTHLPTHLLTLSKQQSINQFDYPSPHRPTPTRIVYRRYASLYFLFALSPHSNPLLALDLIHSLVECLDKYFGSVCELDLVFEFERTAAVVDEWWCGGRMVGEREEVLRRCREADEQERVEKEEARSARVGLF